MMFGNSVSQARAEAQSYLDQARLQKTEQDFKAALVLYNQAKVAFKNIASTCQVTPLPLSQLKSAFSKAQTSQAAEEEALRQRIAEVYFERAELLETRNPGKAQASYKKAQAWGYEEMHPASIPSAVLLSASGLPPVAQITTSTQQKSALVDYLFKKALSTLRSLEVSNKPSLFLIYAHDSSAYRQAEADTSKYLINKLSKILGVILYSDQTPMAQPYTGLPQKRKNDSKLEDILTSQLSLLPDPLQDDVKPVDKVVVCCSELLGSYLGWSHYKKFYQQIQKAYFKDREAYRKNGEHAHASVIRQVVRQFSQEETYKAEFHHVLTEIAFLQIRAKQLQHKHGIIPVSLTPNSYQKYLKKFIETTTVRLEDIPRFEAQSKAGREVYPNQGRHVVLFKLIERLIVESDEAKTFLYKFWEGYDECISRLKNDSMLDPVEFAQLVDSIFNDIQTQMYSQLARIVQQAQKQLPLTPSLIDLRKALYQHYQLSNLSIQRVSGQTALLADCYINLAIVESRAQREKEQEALKKQAKAFERLPSSERLDATNPNRLISVEKLFEPQKLLDGSVGIPKRVLVYGRAGIGKTTLCKKLVYDYQHHAPWRDRFESVLWVPLRQLKTFKSCSLEELLSKHYFASQGNSGALAQAFHQYQDKTLFILDGLDEVIGELDESRLLSRFLTELLNQAHVIITSRPAGVDARWLGQIDLELETVGFSPDNVQAYIQKFALESERLAIQQFIRRTPLIQGLVNIPIQLDALCYSWDTLQSQISADGIVTVTALYQAMVEKLWRKDGERLEKTERGKQLRSGLIQKLSLDELEEQLVPDESEYLCYLAFQGLQDNRIEFDDAYLKEVTKTLNQQRKKDHKDRLPLTLSDDLKQISFLHTTDTERHYHFLHLTFQEYFVAKFLVRHLEVYANTNGNSRLTEAHTSLGLMLSQDKLKTFIAEHKYNPRYEIVWWMVAGLLKGAALENFFTLLEQKPRDLIGVRHQQVIMGCLHEARAQLKKTTVDRLETELMQWFHFGMELRKYALYRQSTFPEHLLLAELTNPESNKQTIIQILSALSTLSTVTISGLSAFLKDEDASVRSAAAYALRNKNTLSDDDISALISSLTDKDQFVRSGATEALGHHNTLSADAIPALLTALKDQNESVRSAAAHALSNKDTLSAGAISALLTALKDENEFVRRITANALNHQNTQLPTDAILALLTTLKDQNESVRSAAAYALDRQNTLPADAIPALSPYLKDQDEFVRSAATKALGHTLSADAIPALLTALKDQNESVRSAATKALGHTLSADAIPALLTALKDQNESVRSAAVHALSCQNTLSAGAISALISSLKDQNESVRSAAAYALGRQNTLSAGAISALISSLTDEHQFVRSAATEALGHTLSADAIPALLTALKDEHESVRSAAAYALDCQNTLSADAIPALISSLTDKHESVRSAATKALGHTLSADAIPALLTALKDQNESVRSAAVNALSCRNTLSAGAISALLTALKDQNESVRSAAANALGSQNTLSAGAISALLTALKDKNESVRSAAANALGSQNTLSAGAISALLTALKDKNEPVRYEAVEALGRQNTLSADAVSVLSSSLKDQDTFVRSIAAYTLGDQNTLSADAISALLTILKDKNEPVRYEAFRTLDSHVDALYPLLPSLDLDLIQALYTSVLFPKDFSQLIAPLYIQDNQLHFYTAKGPGQPIELTSEQSAMIIKALRAVRAEAGIAPLPEEEPFL